MFNFFKKKNKQEQVVFDMKNLSQDDKVQLFKLFGVIKADEPLGDGKAVFLDDGYEAEAKEIKQEEEGIRPWYKRIGL